MSAKSGVSAVPECVEAFNELKLSKSVKWIIYRIAAGGKEIVVEEKGKEPDWESFRQKLIDAKEPRYAVFDLEYQAAGGEGKRSKITFVAWSPDEANVRSKMLYASSKDAIKLALNGIAAEVQANDEEDLEYDEVVKKASTGRH